jgi:nucleoside-diphosphate-sugar epimerase
MKVLVTGANGFLGRHVVQNLVRRGHEVQALVRPAAAVEGMPWHGRAEVFRADLRDGKRLDEALRDVDAVIHLAAAMQGDPEVQFAGTVVTTERLLEAMARSPVRRLVLASSFSVYDWSEIGGTLDEQSPLERDLYTRDGYAVAKVWQERVTRGHAEQHAWELTVLRPGLIWGRGQPYLPRIGQSIGPLHLVLGVTNRLPLTHVVNCADCFSAALEEPAAVGETFNVTDPPSPSSWRLMGEHLRRNGGGGVRMPVPYSAAIFGVKLGHWSARLAFGPQAKVPSVLVPCRFEARFRPLRYDRTKLERVLRWTPPLSFEQAMEQTYGR